MAAREQVPSWVPCPAPSRPRCNALAHPPTLGSSCPAPHSLRGAGLRVLSGPLGSGEWPTAGYLVVLRVLAGFLVTPWDPRQRCSRPAWAACAGPHPLQARGTPPIHTPPVTVESGWACPPPSDPPSLWPAPGLTAGMAHSNTDPRLRAGVSVRSPLGSQGWTRGLSLLPQRAPGQQGVPATRHWLACSPAGTPAPHSQAQARRCGREGSRQLGAAAREAARLIQY